MIPRCLWIIGGWGSLALGVIGIVIPGLPTTPLVILAAFCFSRGSPELHQWLRTHPRFGASLRDWEDARVIRLHAKVLASVMMLTSAVILWGWGSTGAVLNGIVSGIMFAVALFIWRCPAARKVPAAAESELNRHVERRL